MMVPFKKKRRFQAEVHHTHSYWPSCHKLENWNVLDFDQNQDKCAEICCGWDVNVTDHMLRYWLILVSCLLLRCFTLLGVGWVGGRGGILTFIQTSTLVTCCATLHAFSFILDVMWQYVFSWFARSFPRRFGYNRQVIEHPELKKLVQQSMSRKLLGPW